MKSFLLISNLNLPCVSLNLLPLNRAALAGTNTPNNPVSFCVLPWTYLVLFWSPIRIYLPCFLRWRATPRVSAAGVLICSAPGWCSTYPVEEDPSLHFHGSKYNISDLDFALIHVEIIKCHWTSILCALSSGGILPLPRCKWICKGRAVEEETSFVLRVCLNTLTFLRLLQSKCKPVKPSHLCRCRACDTGERIGFICCTM